MKTTTEDVMAIVAKVQAIAALPAAMAELDAEFEAAINVMEEPILELDFDKLYSQPPASVSTMAVAAPVVSVCGNRKISIRIPRRTIAAFKTKAGLSGIGYQTQIVRTLNAACAGFLHDPE